MRDTILDLIYALNRLKLLNIYFLVRKLNIFLTTRSPAEKAFLPPKLYILHKKIVSEPVTLKLYLPVKLIGFY